MINIPTGRRGSFLNTRMSYLKFRVTNTATDAGHAIAADFNSTSIFPRLEVFHGSNLLEQIHEYGLLVNLWHDICGNSAAFGTTGILLEGQSAENNQSSDRGGNSRSKLPSVRHSPFIGNHRRTLV